MDRKVTVVFLLYSEADYVPGLFQAIFEQRHPVSKNQGDWLEVLFIDNGSEDDTYRVMRRECEARGSPQHVRLLKHARNLGIAGALNDAFARVGTPYVLTVHCDVLFGSDTYVATMVDMMDHNPRAGAIAGQPAVPPKKRIPFAEKMNLITNLMDIFPASDQAGTLVPVGFVEGRCEIFRLAALKSAGFYDMSLRLAGEDQVLAARMRQSGYELYQAPDLRYFLSVSNDQNSLWKLVRHQRVFGRAHPYILFRNRNAAAGVIGRSAGANRKLRMVLRTVQLLSTACYLLTFMALLAGLPIVSALMPVALVFLVKLVVFARHLFAVPLTPLEFVGFFLFQPILDLNYTWGVFQGIRLLRVASSGRPIE